MRDILLILNGQSNMRGNGTTDNGITYIKHSSQLFGFNVDALASMASYLVDLGLMRGLRYHVKNLAIGESSVLYWTGRVGATVSGSPTEPLTTMTMGANTLVGGTTPCVEGEADFDPFGFMAYNAAQIASLSRFTEVWALWSNGESDQGKTSADYQAGLESYANYMIAHGCARVYLGLSSKPYTYDSNGYNTLEAGRAAAVAALAASGKAVFDGANLWTHFGASPPLHAESGTATYAHLNDRGQEIHAKLWDSILTK